MSEQEFVRQVGLGFECPDGSYLEERVAISGDSIATVLGEANVFGHHAEFGRRYLGLTGHIATLEEIMEEDDESSLQSVEEVDFPPQLTGEALGIFLAQWDLEAIPSVTEFEQFDALSPSFEEIHWWTESTAFGHATPLAIDLKRCCAADANFAGGAAFAALDAILHKGSLFSVAPVALPYIVDLVCDERVTCRRVLASGLVQIGQAVAEVPDRGRVVEMFERLGSGILALAPLGRAELVDVLRRHVDTARDIRDIWPRLALRLADVADDPGLGKSVRRAIETLS